MGLAGGDVCVESLGGEGGAGGGLGEGRDRGWSVRSIVPGQVIRSLPGCCTGNFRVGRGRETLVELDEVGVTTPDGP